MKRALLSATLALGLAAPAFADLALATSKNCMSCHAVERKVLGPSFKDVAAKYAGQADAQAALVQSIRNGSVGKWGELPMPAHPKLSEADAKKLAAWVLGLK